jgi:hypothetical protein
VPDEGCKREPESRRTIFDFRFSIFDFRLPIEAAPMRFAERSSIDLRGLRSRLERTKKQRVRSYWKATLSCQLDREAIQQGVRPQELAYI